MSDEHETNDFMTLNEIFYIMTILNLKDFYFCETYIRLGVLA